MPVLTAKGIIKPSSDIESNGKVMIYCNMHEGNPKTKRTGTHNERKKKVMASGSLYQP